MRRGIEGGWGRGREVSWGDGRRGDTYGGGRCGTGRTVVLWRATETVCDPRLFGVVGVEVMSRCEVM